MNKRYSIEAYLDKKFETISEHMLFHQKSVAKGTVQLKILQKKRNIPHNLDMVTDQVSKSQSLIYSSQISHQSLVSYFFHCFI
jgi:hypothetical protein